MTLAFTIPPSPDSPLRRLDARWKLVGFTLCLVAVACLTQLLPCVAAFGGSLLLAWIGRLPRRWFLMRLSLVAIFLAPFVLTLPFLSDEVELPFVVSARALTLACIGLVLIASTPWTEVLKAAHALCVPALLVHLVGLTYRYAFLVAAEFGRLRTALRSRGYRNRPDARSYRTIAHVAGTLLVRSHERGERVSAAMQCRGFDGRHRSLTDFRTRLADVVFLLMLTACAVGLSYWDRA